MTEVAFALLLVLWAPSAAPIPAPPPCASNVICTRIGTIIEAMNAVSPGSSQSVIYFPSKDLCEVAAAEVKAKIPGNWQHVCIPMVGAARR